VEELQRDGVFVVAVCASLIHTLVVGNDGRVYGVGSLGAMGVGIADELDDAHRYTERGMRVGEDEDDFKVLVPPGASGQPAVCSSQ
jgi:hypothetical protein